MPADNTAESTSATTAAQSAVQSVTVVQPAAGMPDQISDTGYRVMVILFRDDWIGLDLALRCAEAFPEFRRMAIEANDRTLARANIPALSRRLSFMRTVGIWKPWRQLTTIHKPSMGNEKYGAVVATREHFRPEIMEEFTPMVRKLTLMTRVRYPTVLVMISINSCGLLWLCATADMFSINDGVYSLQIEVPPVPLLEDSVLYISISRGWTHFIANGCVKLLHTPSWEMLDQFTFGVNYWLERRLINYEYCPDIQVQKTIYQRPIVRPVGSPGWWVKLR